MLSGSRAGIYASQAEQERERGWETKRQREKVRMGERDERERLGERDPSHTVASLHSMVLGFWIRLNSYFIVCPPLVCTFFTLSLSMEQINLKYCWFIGIENT